MEAHAERSLSLGAAWRWLMKMGIAVPLIIAAALVALIAILLISSRYQSPTETDAGHVDDYAIGAPKFFEDERFWIVRLSETEVIALYDRDPITGCTVPWDPNRVLLGRTGWFHDACSESTYDLTGACFDGPCEIGLNRLNLRFEADGAIIVDPRSGEAGQLRSENGDPVTPP